MTKKTATKVKAKQKAKAPKTATARTVTRLPAEARAAIDARILKVIRRGERLKVGGYGLAKIALRVDLTRSACRKHMRRLVARKAIVSFGGATRAALWRTEP